MLLTNHAFGLTFVRDVPPEKRKDTIDFHVASGDYFATLATIMGLVADVLLNHRDGAQERCVNTLSELREDLIYAQETFAIKKKR